MIAGPHNWLLGISGTHSRERMERMTESKRSWFWFLGLYVVLSSFPQPARYLCAVW